MQCQVLQKPLLTLNLKNQLKRNIKLDLPRAMASSRKCLLIYVAHIEKIIQPLHLKLYCLSIGQIYLSGGA